MQVTASNLDDLTVSLEIATDAIIRVEHFYAAYDGKTVLKDITFDVRRGEVLVIAGGSGSGKSTLLKHMIGLYRPSGGRILIGGVDLAVAQEAERDRILQLCGVSFQGGRLFGSMTVLENIQLTLLDYGIHSS